MIRKFLWVSISFLLFFGCSELMNLLQMSSIKNPNVAVTGTRISGLSFNQANLIVDIKVDNPNTVGIDMAGLNFDLKINGSSLLSGRKNDPLQIIANGSNTIQLPLTLKYEDLYKIVTSIAGMEKTEFLFEGNLDFELPVIGKVSVPVSKSGEIPLLKFPDIKVKKLSLKSFSFSSAQLEVDISVSGNGGLPLSVNNFNYGLEVAGKQWAGGTVNENIPLAGSGEKVFTIPFKLDFLTMGKTVYDIIAGTGNFDYSFTGDMDLASDHPLFKAAKFSFSDLDKIQLIK